MFSFDFQVGDRVKPSREAIDKRIFWCARHGVEPMDRRGVITRIKSPTLACVRWDPPVGKGGMAQGDSLYMGFLDLENASNPVPKREDAFAERESFAELCSALQRQVEENERAKTPIGQPGQVDKLLPCPWCGEDGEDLQVCRTANRSYVTCPCGARGPFGGAESPKAAAYQWNTRVKQ